MSNVRDTTKGGTGSSRLAFQTTFNLLIYISNKRAPKLGSIEEQLPDRPFHNFEFRNPSHDVHELNKIR